MMSANTFVILSDTCTVPNTSYSQLMVATRMVESKNEETWEKERARATVTFNWGEGTAELS